MNSDRCSATVTLDEPLRRSLSAWAGGQEVAWVHSCALQDRHPGTHRAVSDTGRGEHLGFRWDDSGFRLGAPAEAPERGQHDGSAGSPQHAGRVTGSSGANSAAPTTKPVAPPPHAGHLAGRPLAGPPESGSLTQALWALITALSRLAYVTAAASDRWGFGRQIGGI
jgi:hypothetical protein